MEQHIWTGIKRTRDGSCAVAGKEMRSKTQYLEPHSQQREACKRNVLRGGLVLRGHAVAHGHARILATSLLLLLEVLIVGHLLLLLVGHVARVHAWTGHVTLRRVVSHVLGGLWCDIGSLDAILAGSGIGRIQAGLHTESH